MTLHDVFVGLCCGSHCGNTEEVEDKEIADLIHWHSEALKEEADFCGGFALGMKFSYGGEIAIDERYFAF